MVFSGTNIVAPDNESLLNWGANFRPLTLDGQWWRLLTCCFLHIGIIHLLMNMYALFYVGFLLEPLLGRTRFLSAYLLAGVMASVGSLWYHDFIISAGASGAIFGLYGTFLALLTTKLVDKSFQKTFLTSIIIFVFYNLIYGLKEGIDNAAHIGGLISGAVIGYAFVPSLKKWTERGLKGITVAVLSVAVVCLAAFAYQNIPNNIAKYDESIKEFQILETKALSYLNVFNIDGYDIDNESALKLIKKAVSTWEEAYNLIDELDKMDLPEQLYHQNSTLKEYCELRIKWNETLYKTIDEEDTDKYKDEMNAYMEQIEHLLNADFTQE
jgi:rhomboid protease GluP